MLALAPSAMIAAGQVSTAAVPAAQQVDPVAQAFEAARGSGQPVEITAKTTELTRTLANPDGSYTLEAATVPQRTDDDGTWVPIDTDLVLGAGGLYEPRHASVGLEFSAGGTGPAVSLTRAGTTMRWTWSTPLPAPTIQGDTAVYAEVLPGVDLRLTANETSFSEVLVVRTAEAGQQAAVVKPTFGLTVENGTAVDGPNGTFTVLDDTGAPVMESVTPLMWDSSGAAAERDPQVSDPAAADIPEPEAGAIVAPMKASVAAGRLALVPDAAMLANPALTYPVYLDPTTYSTGTAGRWAMVDKTYPTTEYYKWTDADQGVGYQDFSGVSTKRLLWEFSLGSRLHGTTVTRATFYAQETYAASCTPTAVGVWQLGNFGSTTNWNAQPTWVGGAALDTRSVSFGRAGCATKKDANGNPYVAESDRGVDFDVTSYLKTLTTSTAAYARLGLRAGSETSASGWKRFSRSKTILSVTYDHAPTLVSGAAKNNTVPCVTSSASASAKAFPSTAMTLTSTWQDLDNDSLTVAYVLTGPTGAATTLSAGPTGMNTSHRASFTVKSAVLTASGTYKWVATATEKITTTAKKSVTGPTCYFTIDPTAPGPPVLTSGGATSLSTAAGTTITLDVARGATNGADTVKYAYAVNGDTPVASTAKTVPAGTGTSFPVRISSSGPNSVSVWAYDKVGNMSAPATFPVTAAGWVPVRWNLDQASITDVPASSPPASQAASDPACVPTGAGVAPPTPLKWQKGAVSVVDGFPAGVVQQPIEGDSALKFTASLAASTAATTGLAPMVTTTAESPNYTVMAWVQIPNGGVNDATSPSTVPVARQTVWSVAGAAGPVAKLELVSESGAAGGVARFRFSVLTSTKVISVTSDAELDAGWWRLAASVAPDGEQLQLTVVDTVGEVGGKAYELATGDGAIAPPTGALSVSPAAPTTGSMAVSKFTGSVDELRVFRGALTGAPDETTQVDGEVLDWLRKVRADPLDATCAGRP